MLEPGSIAMTADDCVTGTKSVHVVKSRIQELERQLRRKTMEVEVLKEALDKSRAKTNLVWAAVETRRFAMKAVADVLEVSRANLHDRVNESAQPRRGYHKAQDAVVLLRIQALVAKRPAHG
jgi:hypothetical protein